MKKSWLIIVIILVFISIVLGCKQGPKEAEETTKDVHEGTEGLKMDFVENLPQDKLYDTSELGIMLELNNKGTSDLSGKKCLLYLSGFDKSIIRNLEKQVQCSSSLEEKSLLNPEGGSGTRQFSTENIDLPDYLDSLKQNIVVTACYEYETDAAPVVCINPRLYEIGGNIEGGCRVKDVMLSGGQGAPVEVSKVDVEMAGSNKVAFTITVSNKGGGTVLGPQVNIFNECPNKIDPRDYGVISYDVGLSTGRKIRCAPELDNDERIRLVNGKGKIFCTFEIEESGSAYTTPLRINLNYNYMDSISKNIEIIKTPK